jgi:hypothetical protein
VESFLNFYSALSVCECCYDEDMVQFLPTRQCRQTAIYDGELIMHTKRLFYLPDPFNLVLGAAIVVTTGEINVNNV